MKRKEIYWGILFIIGAILIIVNQLGYFSGVNFLGIAATVVLVGIMLDSLIHLNFGGVLFPAAHGTAGTKQSRAPSVSSSRDADRGEPSTFYA